MQILQYKKTENGKVNKDINVYNVIMYLRIKEDSKQLSQNHFWWKKPTMKKQAFSFLSGSCCVPFRSLSFRFFGYEDSEGFWIVKNWILISVLSACSVVNNKRKREKLKDTVPSAGKLFQGFWNWYLVFYLLFVI